MKITFNDFINEGLFSVKDRPYMIMMKEIYEKSIYERHLSDIEFYTHFNALLFNRSPESNSTTTKNWEDKERILQEFLHIFGNTLANIRHDHLDDDETISLFKNYNGKNFVEYEDVIKTSLRRLSNKFNVINPMIKRKINKDDPYGEEDWVN